MNDPPDDLQERIAGALMAFRAALEGRAAYILEHAGEIMVRFRHPTSQRWTNAALTELQPDIAMREAFRLLFRDYQPHRKVDKRCEHCNGAPAAGHGDACQWCEGTGLKPEFREAKA